MKIVENDHRLPPWLNSLLNHAPMLVDMRYIYTIALGYGASNDDPMRPNWLQLRVGKFVTSMFWNAPVFIRLTWSWETMAIGTAFLVMSMIAFGGFSWWMLTLMCGWFVYFRLTPTHTLQIGIGHKLNGRWSLICRPWHSDASSTQGTLGPNSGQQSGWMWGPH